MGILDRMSTLVKSNLNDLIGRMQDPGKEVDLLVTDMEQQLREARQEVVSASAAEKRIAADEQKLADESALWERRATIAVKAGDDSLAKEALAKKQDVDAKLRAVRADRAQQSSYAAQLKDEMVKFEARLNEIKAKKETIKARARAAKTGTGVSAGGGAAFGDFDRMAGKIEDFEAMGEAEAELAMTGKDQDDAVAAKFAHLEKGPSSGGVEDALAELKRKLNDGK
jgi:phage shock protein A